jgi:hypothetical protein
MEQIGTLLAHAIIKQLPKLKTEPSAERVQENAAVHQNGNTELRFRGRGLQ